MKPNKSSSTEIQVSEPATSSHSPSSGGNHGSMHFIGGLVQHVLALIIMAGLSYVFVTYTTHFKIADLMILLEMVPAIIVGYLFFMAGTYFWTKDVAVSKKLGMHSYIVACFILCASIPTGIHLYNEQKDKAFKTLSLHPMVTDLVGELINKDSLATSDFDSIIKCCVLSIKKNEKISSEMRGSILKYDTIEGNLTVAGYFGDSFGPAIGKVIFDVKDCGKDELPDNCKKRLGVCGYCVRNNKSVSVPNVQDIDSSLPYSYKPARPDEIESSKADVALLCIVIKSNDMQRALGVINISMPEKFKFTKEDGDIVNFFATLLSKYLEKSR